MTARTEILRTRNPSWGFYGTVRHHADPDEAWAEAMRRVVEVTAFSPEAVRDFLDSRRGRHFADEVNGFLFRGLDLDEAIEAAIERWMEWRTGRRRGHEDNTPAGTPFLVAELAPFEFEIFRDALSANDEHVA